MNPLRILVAHNRYRQQGGEDIVAEQEAALLEKHGHTVIRYTRDNRDLEERSLRAAIDAIWSNDTVDQLSRVLKQSRPDLIHVHNAFPLISPSLYWTAARFDIPVVQTLHNFRLLCPQAMLLRKGQVCEDCLGRLPWRAVLRSCYRDSTAQSAVVAGMLTAHRSLGTYRNKISRYIALNRFCRDKFIAGGLPANKIAIKPNFADVPAPDPLAGRNGALFVGRLSEEKGVRTMIAALPHSPSLRIDIVGDGPEREQAAQHTQVNLLGRLDSPSVFAAMRRHAYLVLPSLWYENAPRTVIEAFGSGLPVIASNIGALAELIRDGGTGLLFEPGSAESLARAMTWANDHPEAMLQMGRNARREFEERYTPDRNYAELLAIYSDTLDSHSFPTRYAGARS